MSVNEYELIKIIDNINSKICKFRHKVTGKNYIWKTIDGTNLNKQQVTCLEEEFALRKCLHHPNLIEFHELIKEESSLYHIVVEFCKHGSLQDLMDSNFNQNKRFAEEFLCKILYQISFTFKTVNLITDFNIKDLYFDEDYNVKFFNFNLTNITKIKRPKICTLGAMMFEVCTLTKFCKKTFEKELKNYNNFYSRDFISLLISMVKDNRDLKKNIDKILCNSTLLLKITQWSKFKCFIKLDGNNTNSQTNEKVEDMYTLHNEKLKEKERLLQKKEDILKQREHKLLIKERQISAMEKELKEKLVAGNIKKVCNCSNNSDNNYQKESVKDNLDSTYASCGDSVILPTSKKLNVDEITKPLTFTRTLSEKRIRFKGHSPLKDIDFNRRRSVRNPKCKRDVCEKGGDWLTCSDDTDKSTIARNSVSNKKCKQLFHTYENNGNIVRNGNVPKSGQWTKENKKYAFELLRLMNQDLENKPPDVKHTFL